MGNNHWFGTVHRSWISPLTCGFSAKPQGGRRALAVPGDRVGRASVRADGSVLAVLRLGAVTLELWRLDGDQPSGQHNRVDTNVQVWDIGRRDAPTRVTTFEGFVGQAAAVGHRPADNTFVVVDQDATVWPLRTDLGAARAELCAEAEALSADEWARYLAGLERVPVCGRQAP
ncbi:hypothetical protein BBK82_31250 [Lentzea guizhouensis]|uniref:Uncharacterized protein n=1 Tax=Lentzea guizhouensis TaxID=1586287 RepID=A0A1B2HQ57_9PSEU|nr:hypothetical protein [Lentzea guizhouensis]ANZ39859.1 hypothetical protein BBK82_31250 [Lentzea guizhouensis]